MCVELGTHHVEKDSLDTKESTAWSLTHFDKKYGPEEASTEKWSSLLLDARDVHHMQAC